MWIILVVIVALGAGIGGYRAATGYQNPNQSAADSHDR